MRKLGVMALWVSFCLGMGLCAPAFGTDANRVYLEPDCLSLLGAAKKVPEIARNETPNQTYVEEDQGQLSFDRVTVVEKRDGEVSEAYVQIRNCHIQKNAK